jgi:DNA-binding response OmpR family regulator
MNSPKKIVVVDDDDMTLELIRFTLTKKGFEIFTAHDSMEAIKKIQEEKPDLILLDVMLPDLSGLELLNLIQYKNLMEKAPVILMSRISNEKVIHAAETLGALGYLVKPFDAVALTEKILKVPGFQTLAE